ncbi:hypothetical protein AB0I10_26620 [Streptomyces sp. NPDC050636]|uniref:hypothetical protein n=1 Tax=Streptomyces sp. NPDC050636 TaxID=3154510 RepID=UPI003425D6AE
MRFARGARADILPTDEVVFSMRPRRMFANTVASEQEQLRVCAFCCMAGGAGRCGR